MRLNGNFRAMLAILGVVSLVVAGLLFAPIPPGHATNGRDFAGFYAVTNPTDLGGQFRVTLALRVFNYSGADVTSATITLQDPLTPGPGKDYGAVSAVSIGDGDSVTVSADFTIPGDEYDRWQNGGDPSMRIDYQYPSGNAVQRGIELSQLPGGLN